MNQWRDWAIALLAAVWLGSAAPKAWETLVPYAEAAWTVIEGDQLAIDGPGPHTFGTSGVWEPALKLKTLDPSAQFTLHVGNIINQGVRDNILYWGYNTAGVGSTELLGEPSLRFSLESHYRTNSGNDLMEYNIDYTSADGTVARRFGGFSVDRTTHLGSWAFDGEMIRIEQNMNQGHFVFLPKGTRSTVFRYAGGQNELLQIGNSGGSYSPDMIQIGPTALSNPELRIKKVQLTRSGELAILVYGNYGTPGPKQLQVGAPDSGGPGFRALIVGND